MLLKQKLEKAQKEFKNFVKLHNEEIKYLRSKKSLGKRKKYYSSSI